MPPWLSTTAFVFDQAEPDAVPLGRHEGIEQAIDRGWIDPDAIVAHLDDGRRAAGMRSDGQVAAARHGVRGADDDVQQRALETFRVDRHQWKGVREVHVDHDLTIRELQRQLLDDVSDDVVQAFRLEPDGLGRASSRRSRMTASSVLARTWPDTSNEMTSAPEIDFTLRRIVALELKSPWLTSIATLRIWPWTRDSTARPATEQRAVRRRCGRH